MTRSEHITAKHIQVISNDLMCFWVEPKNMEPRSLGSYDPWCFSDPLKCEKISLSEWQKIRAEKVDALTLSHFTI